MKLREITKSVEKRTFNLNSHSEQFFTEDEIKFFYSNECQKNFQGVKTLETEVIHKKEHYTIDITKEYLEKTLGTRQVLEIIKRLSKKKGVLSKQLFPYYTKVCTGKIVKDVQKIYRNMEEVNIADSNNRIWFTTSYSIHLDGKEIEYSYSDGRNGDFLEFTSISSKHLNRCLAILISKGYLTAESETNGYKHRRKRYTSHNTYYKLTDKAIAYLEKK